VDPSKYKNLRDFVSGGRINIPHMLRRMKLAAKCHNQSFQTLAQALNKLARVRKGFTLTICEDKVITEQPAKSIKVGAIACGLHIESILNGVLSPELFNDYHWTIICESNKLLNSFIASRLTQQCPPVVKISLISDLLASKSGTLPEVDVLFLTLPCTGMTVLREQNQNVPSAEGSMFFDGTQIQIIKKLGLPNIVASECTGPHVHNYEHHVKVTNDINALGYNTSEGSHVHNSACYGGHTSQPRWLPFFVRPNVGNVTNYKFSKLETQHPQPLSQIMSVNESDVETFDIKQVQRIVSDYGIKAYAAQEIFCKNKWDCAQDPIHKDMPFS